MKSIAIALSAIALCGCATTYKFKDKMNGFVGQPEAVIVGTYGPPQGFYQLGDGSKVLRYVRGGNVTLPGATTQVPVTTNTSGNIVMQQGMRQATGIYTQQSTTMVQQQAAPITFAAWCAVNFTIDASGNVSRWSSEGNNCVSD